MVPPTAPLFLEQKPSKLPKAMPKKANRPLSPTMLASSCVMGTRCVSRVEEYVEDRERAKVTVTKEAVGMTDRLPFSAGGVRKGARMSLLSARYHPMALSKAVVLSHNTLSTGVSCQVSDVSSAPGFGEAVRAVGAEMVEIESGPG